MPPTLRSQPELIRVLLVEEDECAFERLRELLHGFRILRVDLDWCRDYRTGFQSIIDKPYDICLLDRRLGGAEGLVLLRASLACGVSVPIVVLGDDDDPELQRKAVEGGAVDYLLKDGLTRDALERSVRFAVERDRLGRELTRLAKNDPLTGLGNRTLFQETLEAAISSANRHGRTMAVIHVDLDRFKNANDTLGHVVGDELLKVTGRRLSGSVRAEDLVARLGADQFGIIVQDVPAPSDVGAIAKKVLGAVREPVVLQGHSVRVGTSVGVAVRTDQTAGGEDLMRAAELAVHAAKESGGGVYRFHDEQLQLAATERAKIEQELAAALDRGQFQLHYQPQIDARTGLILGFEALIRWDHPQRGVIQPGAFVPTAERSGLVVPIGEWVLAQACQDLEQLKRLCPLDAPPRVAVNVSTRQLGYGGLLESVVGALSRSRAAPGDLEIEVTETSVIEDTHQAGETLHALSDLGVHISLDDFGTGYSSLSYLKQLPIDTIKIDRSFVSGIGDDADDETIVRATLALARNLGLSVVAEGVETEMQAEFLRLNECDVMQGFLYGTPVSLARLLAESADDGGSQRSA